MTVEAEVRDKVYDGEPVRLRGRPQLYDGMGEPVEAAFELVWRDGDGCALDSAPSDAGSYVLELTAIPDGGAEPLTVFRSFTIEPAQVTVRAFDAVAPAGGGLPEFSWEVTGLAEGDSLLREPLVSCRADLSRTGSAEISVSGALVPGDGNYLDEIDYIPGRLLVLGTAAIPFGDVGAGDWYCEAVRYVWANGLMDGTEDGFEPCAAATRACVATVLYRLFGTPEVRGYGMYEDVEAGSWYSDAAVWARLNGVADGVSETEFAPLSPVTREQLATMLYRFTRLSGGDVSGAGELWRFSDSGSVSAYAEEAMAWAVGTGLFEGRDGGRLCPGGSATRAELAVVLMRMFSLV